MYMRQDVPRCGVPTERHLPPDRQARHPHRTSRCLHRDDAASSHLCGANLRPRPHPMTERQLIAIAQPCATPPEALANEFYRALRVGAFTLSTILTVNK